MSVVLFIGPTITKSDALASIDAICLPPAAQGDIYRAMRHKPTHIGMVDGYFDGVAAVWHKEILWAMAQGVKVFGASSMGALRAAELADFGMVGVGQIFEDFYSGALEDDDEVAVIHGPAEIGYPALCEPMVNIRATLELAMSERIIDAEQVKSVLKIAKSTHYKQRNWRDLSAVLEPNSKFTDWLKRGKVNQKRDDAIEMIETIQAHVMGVELPLNSPLPFDFETTNQWVRAISQWDSETTPEVVKIQLVLDELRLQPDKFVKAVDFARLRFLALRQSGEVQREISQVEVEDAVTILRTQNGLLSAAIFYQWLEENQLTLKGLEALLAEQIAINNSVDLQATELQYYLLGQLKLDCVFVELSTRATKKEDWLLENGYDEVTVEHTGLPKPALLEWFYCQKLGKVIPSNINELVAGLGLTDREALHQLLAREYLFLQGVDHSAGTN